jgi:hypothetical protein
MARSTDSWRRVASLALAAAALAAAPASAQTVLVPSVTADPVFAPPTGLSDFDFSPGTSVDAASGVAVDGARIYTVGETRINSSDAAIGITARRLDGTLDPGFSEDGKLTISLAAGTQRDAGYAIAVLPGGLLRVLATTDVDAGTQAAQQNLDIAIVGLKPDGSFDETFGGGDGIVTFPAGAGNDVPARMGIDPATGRVAVTGCVIAGTSATSCGSGRDFFVAVRNADGSALGVAVPGGFDANGVRTYNRAGTAIKPNTTTEVILNDRGIDVAWLPSGGLVSLIQVETNPDDVENDWHTVVHAFRADGTDDPGFSGDGDLDLPIGDPDIIPGALLVHDGRLWVTGSVRSGDNGEAFLARMDLDGQNLQHRAYDVRGGVVPDATAVGSQGNDLMVVPGLPEVLVVGGFTTLQEGTAWSAAVFSEFTGDLTAAKMGEEIFAMPRNASGLDQQGTMLGMAVGGEGWGAAAGSLLDLNSADTSYGTARLLIDAEKRCDLTLEIPRPLEIAFDGTDPASVDIKVTNSGTKLCSGAVGVASPYTLSHEGAAGPLPTGNLAPGTSRTFSGAQLAFTGTRKRTDVVAFKITAAGDANAANDTRSVRANFRFCDLRARFAGSRGALPSEGTRRFELTLRNLGTVTCTGVGVRVSGAGRRSGSPDPFTVRAGRSVSEMVRVRTRRGATSPAQLTFTGQATSDVDAANDAFTLTLPVAGVGDSSISRASRRAFAGRATGGKGGLSAKRLRLARVQVSIRRAGKTCRFATAKGRLRKRSCSKAIWLTAAGGSRWRLRLASALPAGTYVVRSRAVIRAGFPEAAFSAADGNQRTIRVG